MEKDKLKGLIDDLVEKNAQYAINPSKEITYDVDTDWKIAYYLYHFLNGRTDVLPDYSFIDEVINSTSGRIVSVGYGIDVSLASDLSQTTSDLEITCTEPITELTTRYDKITKDSYESYTLSGNYPAKKIDTDKFPRYDQKRIEAVEQYLKMYSKEKSGSKSL